MDDNFRQPSPPPHSSSFIIFLFREHSYRYLKYTAHREVSYPLKGAPLLDPSVLPSPWPVVQTAVEQVRSITGPDNLFFCHIGTSSSVVQVVWYEEACVCYDQCWCCCGSTGITVTGRLVFCTRASLHFTSSGLLRFYDLQGTGISRVQFFSINIILLLLTFPFFFCRRPCSSGGTI